MIRTHTYGPFEENGLYTKSVATGKILKVCISSEFTTARVKVFTSDNELLLDTADEIQDVYYPYNIIERIVGDQHRTDYFYTTDMVYITVEGLGDGESIEFMRIYIDE